MAARSPALKWYYGDGYTKTVTLTQEDGGAALPINGHTVEVAVYDTDKPVDTDVPLFTLTGTYVTDGTDGKFTVTPTQEQNTRARTGGATNVKYTYFTRLTLGISRRTVSKNDWKII